MHNYGHMKRFTRISLRTLLVLITLFAVWLAVQVNRAHRQREVVAWVTADGGEVGYDWEYEEGKWNENAEHPAPIWLRGLVGGEYFQTVTIVILYGTQDTDLTPLSNLTNLEVLAILGTEVTDLTPLAKLTDLEHLALFDAPVADLIQLTNVTNLKFLHLRNTTITDAQVKQLQQALPNCEIIH